MPPRIVGILDRLTKNGIYGSRSEAILDAVRRLTLAFEGEDRFKMLVLRSYLGKKKEVGSISDVKKVLNRAKIEEAVVETFKTGDPLKIIEEGRR